MAITDAFPYRDPSLPVEKRVSNLLGRMTLEEKTAQLSAAWYSELSLEDSPPAAPVFSEERASARVANGIGQITGLGSRSSFVPARLAQAANTVQSFLTQHTRLGIPAILHDECASGFMARYATTFPQIIGLSAAWDPELVEEITAVIRSQMRSVGVHQGLAPILDVTRDLRWGRVEETFGEDPYLAAANGTAYVRGLQGPDLREGIIATGKHFAAHGMPEGGLNWAPVHAGKRELREVYLFPFEAAVREAGLAGIMNAYHELDGVPCGASRELLTDILRGEWGFDGIVVSDYNAIVMLADYHHVAQDKSEAARLALEAGLDVELPATDCYGSPLLQAIQAGKIAMETVDEAVSRVLSLKFRLGLFDNPFVDEARAQESYLLPEQRELARRAAVESIVLLKNEGGILPISPSTGQIAVIGPNANDLRSMVGDYTYSAFTALIEGGDLPAEDSSFPERFPPGMHTVLQSIRERLPAPATLRYAQGCSYAGGSRDGFEEAISTARQSDIVIFVAGGKSGLTQDCTSGELRDRSILGLPGVQEELLAGLVETGTPIVLVLINGRPVALPGLEAGIPAILQAWLPGQEGGPAVADVLFGEASPGGKLPISIPRSAGQIPVFYGHKPSGGQSYNFIDYVDQSVKPLYPFGHGLSYTQFEYSDLRIEPGSLAPGGTVSVQVHVQNAGSRKGDEVIQLYLRDCAASVTRPVKELKGFRRISLDPGAGCDVVFQLHTAQMAFYDLHMRFVVEPGEFELMVGSSSEDIRLTGRLTLTGDHPYEVTQKVFFSESRIQR